MVMEESIGTCKCVVTEDGTLTISPAKGETGRLDLAPSDPWPWCRKEIKRVRINGHIKAGKDMTLMFDSCAQLEDISDLAKLDVSNVISMMYMFNGCSRLNDLSPLKKWDVRNVRYMRYMFAACDSIRDISALSEWDTSNVEEMIGVFAHCGQIGDLSAITGWDTGNVRSVNDLFNKCRSLTDISALAGWNTNRLASIDSIFSGCCRLSDISPLGKWNVSSVVSMNSAFEGCVSLEDISPLSGWNVEHVISMKQMFEGCVSVTNADAVGNWDIKRLGIADNMFCNTGIKENPLWQKVPMACPETGCFTAWKKCRNEMMVKLLVPGNARRSSAFDEKCRCDRALVLQIFKENDDPAKMTASIHDSEFIYRVGETVSVSDFDPDRFSECTAGIHFFMNRKDAKEYW